MSDYKGLGIFVYCLAMTALTAVNFNQVKDFPKLVTFNTVVMIISLITAVISMTYWALTSLSSCSLKDVTSNLRGASLENMQNLFLFLLFSSSCVLAILSATSEDFASVSSTAKSLVWSEIGLSGFALLMLGLSVVI